MQERLFPLDAQIIPSTALGGLETRYFLSPAGSIASIQI